MTIKKSPTLRILEVRIHRVPTTTTPEQLQKDIFRRTEKDAVEIIFVPYKYLARAYEKLAVCKVTIHHFQTLSNMCSLHVG